MNRTNLWHAAKDKARRGAAALEFALTLPIWIALLLGVSDTAYFLMVNEKTDRVAYTITDIVTQYETITNTNINDIFLAASQLMKPFSFDGGNGAIILTSVYQGATGNPVIKWQRKYPSGTGKAGTVGSVVDGTAVLPTGLTLNANDNVIISEVYYTFTPMFLSTGLFHTDEVYRFAVYKPRLSPLVTPPL